MTSFDRDQLRQEHERNRCRVDGLIITFIRPGEPLTHLFPKNGPQAAHFAVAFIAHLGELRSGDRLIVYRSGDQRFGDEGEGKDATKGTLPKIAQALGITVADLFRSVDIMSAWMLARSTFAIAPPERELPSGSGGIRHAKRLAQGVQR